MPIPSRAEAAAYGAGLLAAVLVVGGFALGFYPPNLHNGLLAAGFTAVGVFVVLRRPGNREAWLLVATGAAHSIMFVGRQYGLYAAAHGLESLPAVPWATWFGVWPLPLVLVLTGVTIMSFPDGRLPSRRWRAVVAAMASAAAVLAAASALWPLDYAENALAVPHPLAVDGLAGVQPVWNAVAPALFLSFQIAWAACLVVRLRRAQGDEVRQLRWFVYAVSIGVAAMALSLIVLDSAVLGVLAAPLIPAAAGVAILKYRLYDIDPVVNKTLVVGTMAAAITAAYVAVVVGLGSLVGASTGPNVMLSLAATALIAVAFDPVRRRVQAWADRLVYGQRATPYEALARLSSQLTRADHRVDLLAELASAIAAGVGAAEVILWVGSADDLVPVAAWPPDQGSQLSSAPSDLASLQAAAPTEVRPILHHGAVRGAVMLTKAPGEALSASEDRLLQDLAAQAGLVIDNVDLGAELRERLQQISTQAAELRAAAKRIVVAQDEARRRIERDLHDGAQQRLVTLALELQALAERASCRADDDLSTRIDQARHELRAALAELREMARGIHPAILSEGLAPALGSLAERSSVPVRLDVRVNGRLPEDMEAAAYFVVSEALVNAAKHASASNIVVSAEMEDSQLKITVTDDGIGGADVHAGTGLQGLADRLTTLNGRLTIESPKGRGTRVAAEVPCA